MPTSLQFKPIPANLAIDLYQGLIVARRLYLQPALSEAVGAIGVVAIDADLQRLVSADALTHLAQLGLRGERVFPVSVVLTYSPALLGYYRMLLGLSKKEFSQANRLGYAPWVRAEETGKLSPVLRRELDRFCAALIAPLTELVYAMDVFTDRDLSDLTLLTLGPSLQGGRNNVIGTRAAGEVLDSIRSLVEPWITLDGEATIRFEAPHGGVFDVIAGSDPDIRIDSGAGLQTRRILAIEVKGGADASNAHNRAGEAEKSQIKAKGLGYVQRWTVIVMRGLNRARIREETPSSTEVFDANQVIQRNGADWEAFRVKFLAAIGE